MHFARAGAAIGALTVVVMIGFGQGPAKAQSADEFLRQLQRQIETLSTGANPTCATNAERGLAAVRDSRQTLEEIRAILDAAETGSPENRPQHLSDATSARDATAAILADLARFRPQYESLATQCGEDPRTASDLALITADLEREKSRADRVVTALAAAQEPEPGPVAIDPTVCTTAIETARAADADAARFRTNAGLRIETLQAAGEAAQGSTESRRLKQEIDEKRATLDRLVRTGEPLEAGCPAALSETNQALVGQILALQTLGDTASRLAAPPPEPQLTREQRMQIQEALASLGHYRGGIDAAFGPGTRRAITAWQTATGGTPTGYLNREQANRLISIAAGLPQEEQVVEPQPETQSAGRLDPVPSDHVADVLMQELPIWSLPPTLSTGWRDARSDDPFALLYGRMRAYADDGRQDVVLFSRYELAGMALLDHGRAAAELFDAHLLIAQAQLASGEWEAAAAPLAEARRLLDDLARSTDRRQRRAAEEAMIWISVRQQAIAILEAIDRAGGRQPSDRALRDLARDAREVEGRARDFDRRATAADEAYVLVAAVAALQGGRIEDEALFDEVDRLFLD